MVDHIIFFSSSLIITKNLVTLYNTALIFFHAGAGAPHHDNRSRISGALETFVPPISSP